MKEQNEQPTVPEALYHKSIGPRDLSSNKDLDKIKAEIKETKELAIETQKQYIEVVDCSRSPISQVYWAPGFEFQQGPRQNQS
jgi:hypothetical protein